MGSVNIINRTTSDYGLTNKHYNRVGPLITVDDIKKTYLFGLLDISAEDGSKTSDDTIQRHLDTAISMLETDLDISIMPRFDIEMRDYDANAYMDWGFLYLHRTPVIEITRFRAVYLAQEVTTIGPNGPAEEIFETALEIPLQWIRIEPATGMIRLIPSNKFPSRLQVDSIGSFFPELFRRHGSVPSLWRVEYLHGFKAGAVPKDVNAAIGLLTSVLYFLQVSDIFPLGAGIAQASISLDGISQSIATTASAENMTLSAKIKEYNRLLYGDRTLNIPGIIPNLRTFWNGQRMSII